MTTWFVSRHPGALQWMQQCGPAFDCHVPHLDTAQVQRGDTVIGTLPVNLAAQVCARGAAYWHLALEMPAQQRGPTTRWTVLWLAIGYLHHGSCAMDEQGSQIGVPPLADAQQVLLAAAGVLPGHQPEPSRQLATIMETLDIAQRCNQCAGRDRSDPWNLFKPLAFFMLAMPLNNLAFQFLNLLAQLFEVIEQAQDQEPE